MDRKSVLVCAPCIAERDRESGSRRVADLLHFLRKSGWRVTFASTNPAEARYINLLEQQGIETYAGDAIAIDHLIATRRFDLAILAFWHVAETYLPKIRAASPQARITVDSIDLHFVRNARQVFTKAIGANANGELDAHYADEMVRELNVYAAADSVWTVSQKEADLVNDLTGDPLLAQALPDTESLSVSPYPISDRKGIVFLGNFRHAPNVDAVHYFLTEVLPHLPQSLLDEHPLYIVGNAMTDSIRELCQGRDGVRMVGWVPDVLPYLERARVSVIPLRYGAGTKRKLIQSMLIGTPSVSTSVGIEGLNLHDREHVLVADSASSFAEAIETLLKDADLWRHVSESGRNRIQASHGRDAVQLRFDELMLTVSRKQPKQWQRTRFHANRERLNDRYKETKARIRKVVSEAVSADAKVLVVSKGDDELLELEGRSGWHFPQINGGDFAGHHPKDSDDAIAQLELLRTRGAGFLLFPNTSFWWLDHYSGLRLHLANNYLRIVDNDDCIIYKLSVRPEAKPDPVKELTLTRDKLEAIRPKIALNMAGNGNGRRKRVLVLGVYLANEENNSDDVVARLSETTHCDVTQRWVRLGEGLESPRVEAATTLQIRESTPKFQIIETLLAQENLADYDYLLLCDDDVVLPRQFLDSFIALQERLGFAIAQPARTSNSYIDHPIVEQQRGVLARQTLFVEIGPVVSFHKSVYDLVFPFDLTSPMGWGYENVWSYLLTQRNMKMGIIDGVPVDHSLRAPVAHYSWTEADQGRKRLFEKHKHFPTDKCMRVLEVIGLNGTTESRN